MVAGVPRGKGLIRTAMILPILVPPVAIGAMWKLVYNYDFGILNQALGLIGIDRIQWLSSADLALWSVVLVDVWHWTPLVFLILFAGVEGLPGEVIEAARVDGATQAQAFRRVILPLVVPGLIAAGVLAFVFSWNEFSVALNLTSRGTATVPVGIANFAEQYEVQNGNMAAAAVLSTIPALILMMFGQRFVVQGLTMGAVK